LVAGDLTLALQRKRPDFSVLGLDISAVNIVAATERAKSQPAGDRRFPQLGGRALGDRRRWRLHLINAKDDRLAHKASDILPGGLLIAIMPTVSVRNQLLLLRRVWRVMPAIADLAVRSVAKWSELACELLR
jgi:hypothetical protein